MGFGARQWKCKDCPQVWIVSHSLPTTTQLYRNAKFTFRKYTNNYLLQPTFIWVLNKFSPVQCAPFTEGSELFGHTWRTWIASIRLATPLSCDLLSCASLRYIFHFLRSKSRGLWCFGDPVGGPWRSQWGLQTSQKGLWSSSSQITSRIQEGQNGHMRSKGGYQEGFLWYHDLVMPS